MTNSIKALIAFFMFAAALASIQSEMHAKVKPLPNIQGATDDPEAQCVSKASAIFLLQIKEPEADRKLIEIKFDRFEPFMDEVGEKMATRFNMTPKLYEPIYEKINAAISADYARDKSSAIADTDAFCEPLITQSEAVRIPVSPQRCWALRSKQAQRLLGSASILGRNPEEAVLAMLPNIGDVLEASRWRKWAKAELMNSRKTEKEAEKLVVQEKRQFENEWKKAEKAGYRLVFDKNNCQQRYQLFLDKQKGLEQKI